MTSVEEYAKRKAEHLAPVGQLSGEEIKAEVGQTFSLLVSALDSLSEAQATWKPNAEEWSAAQVCDHVALGTGVAMNVTGLLAKGQRPSDADWDPPPQFKGDAGDLKGIRSRLTLLPGATADLYDQCQATNRLDVTADNSFFGEMDWREWFYFLRVHALSHVEQIEKLRTMAGFPQ